jgi:GntR family transcriptional regulator of vanillate catabolism
VRAFTVRDIEDAIEMRGTLEGIAARLAAERGVSPGSLGQIISSVESIDEVLHEGELSSDEINRYFELNASFHNQLIALSESFVVESMIERIVSLPFASPNAFVIAQSEIEHAWKVFLVAQEHHKGMVEAIENREGTRAESLAREHARLSLQTLRTALISGSGLHAIPGIKLIRH